MPVTGEELRDLMRSIPTSVVVVAAMSEEGARGMTVGSFASVSLDPPLVCFNVMRASRVHTVFLQASRFVISILSDRQAEIAIRFARSGLGAREQFHGVPHRLDPEGNPMLDGAIGWLSCLKRNVFDGGDHSIILGEVQAVMRGSSLPPLIYYEGEYRKVGDRAG